MASGRVFRNDAFTVRGFSPTRCSWTLRSRREGELRIGSPAQPDSTRNARMGPRRACRDMSGNSPVRDEQAKSDHDRAEKLVVCWTVRTDCDSLSFPAQPGHFLEGCRCGFSPENALHPINELLVITMDVKDSALRVTPTGSSLACRGASAGMQGTGGVHLPHRFLGISRDRQIASVLVDEVPRKARCTLICHP
jgi:hypothetical protein